MTQQDSQQANARSVAASPPLSTGAAKPSRARRFRVLALVHAVAGAALVGHFAMTALYVMPLSPLRRSVAPVVDSYIDPVFSQNWRFFAPYPMLDSRAVLVSCRLPGGEASAGTPWVDITTPVRELKYRYRFTPGEALDYLHLGGQLQIFMRHPDIEEKVLEHEAEMSEFATLVKSQEAYRKRRGELLLQRLASRECDRMYGRGEAAEVGVRLAITKTPPFSKRNDPPAPPEVTLLEIGWWPRLEVAQN